MQIVLKAESEEGGFIVVTLSEAWIQRIRMMQESLVHLLKNGIGFVGANMPENVHWVLNPHSIEDSVNRQVIRQGWATIEGLPIYTGGEKVYPIASTKLLVTFDRPFRGSENEFSIQLLYYCDENTLAEVGIENSPIIPLSDLGITQ